MWAALRAMVAVLAFERDSDDILEAKVISRTRCHDGIENCELRAALISSCREWTLTYT